MNREIAGCARINKKLALDANLTNGEINPLIGAAGLSATPWLPGWFRSKAANMMTKTGS
jgi:Na+-transporting methylmalonyl-CoA/oxaloacetate decarboxylase beta subunit